MPEGSLQKMPPGILTPDSSPRRDARDLSASPQNNPYSTPQQLHTTLHRDAHDPRT